MLASSRMAGLAGYLTLLPADLRAHNVRPYGKSAIF